MDNNDNISEIKMDRLKIIDNKELNIWEALIPVFVLIGLLAYNIFFKDGEVLGEYSNQYILIFSGVVAMVVGFFNKVKFNIMLKEIWENFKSVFIPILILLLVGALAGTWLVSGIIPTMVYYGLDILSPSIFLPASLVICIIISVSTGSSWTTSATVGIALMGIGSALGINSGMIAGAVISGAYFGDKISPLSDTTNLASAMAGTDLFSHIRYMSITTLPTIIITLIVFSIMSFFMDTNGVADVSSLKSNLAETFQITPFLFIVPLVVIGMIVLKVKPLLALLIGVLLAGIFALIFQTELLASLSKSNFSTVIKSIFLETEIPTENKKLAGLYSANGMIGMLSTIFLIVSAMIFGGVMDGIGALARITKGLLKLATTTFGLFGSTVASCIGLNIVACDQYLAIVIPGKMFKQAYDNKGLAPQNLSRTLEDSGTVTSALVPWNTGGAYQSTTLGVGVGDYFVYAIFNWLSPLMTLLFAALNIKIKQLVKK